MRARGSDLILKDEEVCQVAERASIIAKDDISRCPHNPNNAVVHISCSPSTGKLEAVLPRCQYLRTSIAPHTFIFDNSTEGSNIGRVWGGEGGKLRSGQILRKTPPIWLHTKYSLEPLSTKSSSQTCLLSPT